MFLLRHRLSSPSPVVFACLFASQAALLVLSPILPDVAHDLGVSTATAGQLRTVSGATGGVTALALALARRRPGLRTLLSWGAALVAAGSLAAAAAPTFLLLAVTQAVTGVGVGLLVAVGIAATAAWTAPGERARTLSWAIAGMPCAWVAGMPVVGAAAAVHWRLAFVAVPALSALACLVLVRLRAADPATRRTGDGAAAWKRPEVARFTAGELLANAAWASVLTYCGALLIESYGSSRATVALGLGAVAAAMVPGTFFGRRVHARASIGLLVALTLFQGAAVAVLGGVRPDAAVTLGVLVVMAFVNGWRSMVASGLGIESAPDDPVAVMSLRAAANQYGYLLGAAAGGAALAAGGFGVLGTALAGLFAAGAAVHGGRLPARYRRRHADAALRHPHRALRRPLERPRDHGRAAAGPVAGAPRGRPVRSGSGAGG